jgi:hypothetical protein
MMPIFSLQMIRELDAAVASAAAKSETLNLCLAAEAVRARNARDNIALEDVLTELMWRASRSGVTMEISSDSI